MYPIAAWPAAALAALGPPLLALATYSFLLLRLSLYVICVSIAWVAILEQSVPEPQAAASRQHSRPPHGRARLTAASLAEHDAAESLEMDSLASSELDDQASLSEETEAVTPAAPRTPAPAPAPARRPAAQPVAAPAARPGAVQVERSAVPADAGAATPRQQELKEAVASAAQGAQEGATAAGRGGKRRGHSHKKRKPLLNRLVERYLWSSTDVHGAHISGAGYMVYRGLGRMGRLIERSAITSGGMMERAIREAGVDTVTYMDHLARKWLLFSITLAVLTIALLPLPAGVVTLNLVLGGGSATLSEA